MVKVYYDKDCDLSLIKNKSIAIIGYGSQGRAHALNLHDSGANVCVGLREGSSTKAKVEADGLVAKNLAEAVFGADLIMILSPDEVQKELYNEFVEPNLKSGAVLAFAHGLNVHFSLIQPPKDCDVIMIAPKGPGYKVREEYEIGSGVPCLVAVHQDHSGSSLAMALSYASAIGGGRSGIIETDFKEECETDLFGEQAVLCGGLAELIKAGFETLVEAGYSKEMAYFECMHEVKLIVDLLYEGGFAKMNKFVSNTAEYGEYVSGPVAVPKDETKARMKTILERIQSGKFVSDWMSEYSAGLPMLLTTRKNIDNSDLEKTGQSLRSMMSWIKKD